MLDISKVLSGYITGEKNTFEHPSKELEATLEDDSIFSLNSSDVVYENEEFTSTSETEESENEDDNVKITDLLNQFIKNEKVQNIVDADESGTLDIEEINDFLDAIENMDENPEDISLHDIFAAIATVEDGTFMNEEVPPEELIENNPEAIEAANAPSNAGRRGGASSGGTGVSAAADGASNTTPQISLEEQKEAIENDLEETKNNIAAIHAGTNEAVQKAQQECDLRKEEYETALEEDENISEELRNKQEENQNNIDNQKSIIDETNASIDKKEDQIHSQKNTVASDKSTISALKSAISNLRSESSDDPEQKANIQSKINAAQERLSSAEAKLTKDEQTLQNLENEKAQLEKTRQSEEEKLAEFEEEREAIEKEILANCGEATKAALEAFKDAQANVDTIKANELQAAENEKTILLGKLDEINAQIRAQEAKKVEKEFSINSLDNPEKLYETMGLKEQGLNYEVFLRAVEGYNNLDEEDKKTGFLGIFDTTQDNSKERYYLLDLNTFELVGRSVMKTGSGNMDDVVSANKGGSHATLSGFEKVAEEYYSHSMGKNALKLDGLEPGINDNARAKGTVVHYTPYNSTWGCKGFPPVRTNGKINLEATYQKMRELFPTGSIVFTYPTDENYYSLSELYN